MIEKPLMQNPLSGGQLRDLPAGGGLEPRTASSDPNAPNYNPNFLEDPFSNITAPGSIPDRYKQGFEDFYSQNPNDYQRIGGQAISYVTTPQGETIRFGDTGGASNFRRYLESIGETPKDDLLSISTDTSTQPLPPGFDSQENPFLERGDYGIPDNNAFAIGFGSGDSRDITSTLPNQGVGQDVTGNNPIETPVPSTPNPIQGTGLDGAPVNSYNRVGKQLTGPDQFGDLNNRLNKIEQGIMSLLGNGGQNSSMNFNSPYNFNWGLSSFPPFGGMYG